ncbi:glycosyltransferase [Nocardia sp. NPDC088792]|uniref:glycosyltransferase n=1 Tax=Nocardia sp. NPDC088792 TaxID=3364332 RepID=UPI003820374A
MRVDVVTAAHSAYANFLPATWLSLNAQTHTAWRWLVQCDGKGTAVRNALIACGASDDSRVQIAANGTQEGPAVTRNVALGRSSAALIQNLDADDELEPTALAALAQALENHPAAGYAAGPARDLLSSGALVDFPLPLEPGRLQRGALVDAWITTSDDYRVPVHPAGVMWRRDLLLALGGWSAMSDMEDTGLLMAASALCEGVLIDTPTLRYRRHRAQRSKKSSGFVGGGGEQITLVRQRTALLRRGPSWRPALPPHSEDWDRASESPVPEQQPMQA